MNEALADFILGYSMERRKGDAVNSWSKNEFLYSQMFLFQVSNNDGTGTMTTSTQCYLISP